MHFLRLCLVCWAGRQRFASIRFQLRSRRQCGLEVHLSTWENSAFPGELGSLSVTWRTWDATQEATHLVVLALCAHSSRLLLRRFLPNFGECHELLDFFCVISKTNTFRQGKVVISKSASFLFMIKDALVVWHSFQFCTPRSGLQRVNLLVLRNTEC